ncbi:MAG: hypothetical protein LC753_02910 [Acidobacteria bacterium]|nr:hypothetical protein [Acidobacteriota bacterium]MCA1649252.1 hypothetical protein [Acidobacteriota bacterium]
MTPRDRPPLDAVEPSARARTIGGVCVPPSTHDAATTILRGVPEEPPVLRPLARCVERRAVLIGPSTTAPPRFNAHSKGPRPPQTPAALFKRLYRK